jgi:hypothetical protein
MLQHWSCSHCFKNYPRYQCCICCPADAITHGIKNTFWITESSKQYTFPGLLILRDMFPDGNFLLQHHSFMVSLKQHRNTILEAVQCCHRRPQLSGRIYHNLWTLRTEFWCSVNLQYVLILKSKAAYNSDATLTCTHSVKFALRCLYNWN